MIEYIKYRYKLAKLEKEKNKIKKSYDSYIKEVPEEIRERDKRIAEAMAFISEIDLQIKELYTDYMKNIANKLMVPIPNYNDENIWEKPMGYRSLILTRNGMYELKKFIRLERKERREIIFSWITLLIGLIGVLIGLFSVLKN